MIHPVMMDFMWRNARDSVVIMEIAFDGLVQERCDSSALAMELHLSCTNPSLWYQGHVWHKTKWLPFCRWHFQMCFLGWKCLHFASTFTVHEFMTWSLTCSFQHWLLYIVVVTLSMKWNSPHFEDDISKCFLLNENISIVNRISLEN